MPCPRTEWRFYLEAHVSLLFIFQQTMFDYRRVNHHEVASILYHSSLQELMSILQSNPQHGQAPRPTAVSSRDVVRCWHMHRVAWDTRIPSGKYTKKLWQMVVLWWFHGILWVFNPLVNVESLGTGKNHHAVFMGKLTKFRLGNVQ